MTKYLLLFSLIVFYLSSCSFTEESKKPNIIVLLVDDAGYADFGFADSKDLETPNIDRLANNGMVCTDAHVTASVCGPSRAGLMVGRYQQRFGFECNPSGKFTGLDLNETTIADAMKQAGYKTGAFGKWHLGSSKAHHPNQRGFDYFWGFLSGGRSYFYNKNNDKEGDDHALIENNKMVSFDGYLTDRLGDKAVDFIDRNKENPFFMYWAPNAVHTPMEAAERDLKKFEGHPRQKLAAMTYALDRAVGSIVKKLESENLLDNTIIYFLSDNGGAGNNQSINLPLKGFKGNKFEGGHRVQFFVHYPNKIKSGHYDGLISSLDIFATSVSASGSQAKTNKTLDGVNLLPYFNGEKRDEPHASLFWRKDKMAAVRKGDNKVIRVERLKSKMYNLEENIGETEDLSLKNPKLFNDLNKGLESWESELMSPLWTEGAKWDTITWMIHEDYLLNREVRVKDPGQLRRWKLQQTQK